MKKYFGNYLGIVISRKDTESRGRLKIYIPHIMPVLNANLLNLFGVQGEETISFNAVGGNISGGIPESARAYLENILPYSEPASPIIGSSSPCIMDSSGNVNQNAIGAGDIDKSALVPGNAGVVATPNPSKIISPPSTDEQGLFQNSAKYGKVSPQAMAGNQGAGLCATGVRQIAGGLTGNDYFSNGLSSGSGGSADAASLSRGNDYFQKSGYYQSPQSMPADYTPQKGDIVSGTKGNSAGHVQIYDGQNWVSDFTQSGLSTSYEDMTLHRMTPEASANIGGKPTPDAPPKPVDNNIIPTTNDGYSCPASYNITTNGNKQYITLDEARNINRCNVIGSKLVGFVPKDGASYGITTGSVEEWTAYFSRQMLTESAHTGGKIQINDSMRENDAKGTISEGLFSLTIGEQGLTSSTISNPVSNSAAAIKISANLITADGVIAGKSSSGGWLGAARYFGPLRDGKIKVNGEGVGTYDQSPNSSGNKTTATTSLAGNQTMTTSKIGPSPYDTTNVAKGVFSIPQVGALLWCFFREGNPLFPVYFAASYRAGEWASASKAASPGVNNDTSLDGDATRSSATIMPTKGGGVISTEGAGSHEVGMVAYSGGHLKFHENHTILYSPDDFHTQADGNKFDITLSNRETHTKGICNTVVNGDCFEKIGNVTDQSVHDAINGIESLISKINDEMLKHS